MANIISFVHHKGGTGKTTACINIAGWLSKMDKRVLVVDIDPQGSATSGLGIDRKTIALSIYDVLFGNYKIGDILLETESGVYLVPSSLDLLMAETHLAGQVANTVLLKKSLESVERYFDYILIDVPPASTLLMINGIVASQNIIIPVDSGVFAFEALDTLKKLILDLHDEVGITTNILMVILKQYPVVSYLQKDPTKETSKMIQNFLEENKIADVKIYSVPFSRKIYKAQMKGNPISHYSPLSEVGRTFKRITESILHGK